MHLFLFDFIQSNKVGLIILYPIWHLLLGDR